jgi:hypothetical protein
MMAKRKRRNHSMTGLPNLNKMDGKPEDAMGIFMNILVDSYVLADEPEFIDFRFDSDKAYASADQVSQNYARDLRAAEKAGGDQLEFVQENILIETIDRLLNPQIRQDILYRLDSLLNRLQTSKGDFEKLTMTAALKTAFEADDFPWGMSNLTVELFQRSIERAAPGPDVAQLFEQVEALAGKDLSPEEFVEKISDPGFVKELESKIDTDSEIFQRIADQADQISDDFINAVFHGRVELDLFSEAELLSFLKLMQEQLLAVGQVPSKADIPEVRDIFQAAIHDYIQEIVTPERLEAMKVDLQAILKTWLKEGNKYAGPLLTETNYLDREAPAENFFIRVTFLSQLRRATREIETDETAPPKKPRHRRRKRRKK